MANKAKLRKIRRAKRIRAKIRENDGRARLSVHRTNKGFYAQIIDDSKGTTLIAVSAREVDAKGMKKSEVAEKVGDTIAQKAKEKKVKKVVFDKGPYKYHGRVKSFAEAARKGGLEF